MADGLGGIDGFWQAQTELAKQVSSLAQQVGVLTERVDDRVTGRELMNQLNDFRKELVENQRANDQRHEKVLDGAVTRMREILDGITADSVAKAMTAREQQEAKAQDKVIKSETDLERRVRTAQRNSAISWIISAIAVLASVAQAIGIIGK